MDSVSLELTQVLSVQASLTSASGASLEVTSMPGSFVTLASNVLRGPQGPPGEPGAPGVAGPAGDVSGQTYDFAQANNWTLNHNLGRQPFVTLLSVGGAQIEADVVHTSLNQFVVYFAAPQAGRVRVL